jgi:hypothetical protein
VYEKASDGLKAVREDYHYWTEMLTKRSLELSVALIAANWAVFGSVERVLQNAWSKLSIIVLILGVAIGLFGAWRMGEMHRLLWTKAENDPEWWQREYEAAAGTNKTWPFTSQIESFGDTLRKIKLAAPLLGGLLFIVALALA